MTTDDLDCDRWRCCVGLLVAGTLGGRAWHMRRASFQAPATRGRTGPGPAAPNRSNRSDPSDRSWLPCRPASWSICWTPTRSSRAQAELTLNDAQYGTVRHPAEATPGGAAAESARAESDPAGPAEADRARRRRRRWTRRRARAARALRDHDERATAEMRKAYETLDEVLDVRQQARFRIFEETIERRKLDLVRPGPRAGERGRARRRAGQAAS